METWEEIALRLAGQAGIATSQHELIQVAGKAVMLSRRFDRAGATRIPFLSAMAMMGAKDGERGSYPEIVDALAQTSRVEQGDHAWRIGALGSHGCAGLGSTIDTSASKTP
jgi:serine/threonine protein kinase HipA of HipAB toxin-antitoxin module